MPQQVIDPSWPHPRHNQVSITLSVTGWQAIVDEGIADDILHLWRHGIQTMFSCQGDTDEPHSRYVALRHSSDVMQAVALLPWAECVWDNAFFGHCICNDKLTRENSHVKIR